MASLKKLLREHCHLLPVLIELIDGYASNQSSYTMCTGPHCIDAINNGLRRNQIALRCCNKSKTYPWDVNDPRCGKCCYSYECQRHQKRDTASRHGCVLWDQQSTKGNCGGVSLRRCYSTNGCTKYRISCTKHAGIAGY
jgi:hypothetical protein